MSDTIEQAAPEYATRVYTTPSAGGDYQVVEVGFGTRKVVVRNPEMVDQFDLAEFAGEAANSESWTNMALVAMAVEDIDGTPVMKISNTATALRKNAVRSIIQRLGTKGLPAAAHGIRILQGNADGVEADGAAAKN